MSQNDFKDKFIALQNLSKIKNLIIEKSDKINSLLMFDRQDNMKKLNNILSDQEWWHFQRWHFTEFCYQPRKTRSKKNLLSLTGWQKKIRKSLKPVGRRPSVMYGSCKRRELLAISVNFIGLEDSYVKSCDIVSANIKTFDN